MKRLVPIAALLLALQACNAEPTPVTAPSPFVRLPAVPGRPASGYFEVNVNPGQGALTSVSSPQAGRVEMHETMSSGNMTSMRPLDRVAVPAGQRLVFAPGGRHLMLYDLAPAVRPGGEVTLVLHFEHGPPVALAARVESAGGPE